MKPSMGLAEHKTWSDRVDHMPVKPARRTKIHKTSLMTRCREKTELFKFTIVFICYLVSVVFRVVSTESILRIVLGLYIKGRYVCLETIPNSERTDSLRSCGLPI